MAIIDGILVCEDAAGCQVPPQEPTVVAENIIDIHVWSATRFRDFLGIGDTLVYLPAIRAFAKKFPKYTVRLVTLGRNKCWARWGYPNVVDEEEMTVFGGKHQLYPAYDVSNIISLSCMEQKISRVEMFAKRLGVEPEWTPPALGFEHVHAAGIKLKNIGWTSGQPVVVIAPYTKSQVRTWPLQYWLELQTKLKKEDIFVLSVAALPTGEFEHTLSSETPSVIQAILAQTICSIGGDSGFMHFAGLCGTKGIALCGPTHGAVPFGAYSNIKYISGGIPCSSCWFLKHRQYVKDECRKGCKSLAAISVDTVFGEVMKWAAEKVNS